MRHIPEPVEPDAPLPAGDAGPLNDQGSTEFNVGGVERALLPAEQLEQLLSYMHSTYPEPAATPPWKNGGSGADSDGGDDSADSDDRDSSGAAMDRYIAHLPDRITHAAMLMLGSGLDHSMPGVAYGVNIAKTRELPALSDIPDTAGEPVIPARIFVPSSPTRRWAVSLHPGGLWRGAGPALEMNWRPDVAAAAELSGTTILDLDYPLAPDADLEAIVDSVDKALTYVESQVPHSVSLWGRGAGAALVTLVTQRHPVDALVLTYPNFDTVAALPSALHASLTVPSPTTWPRTLLQTALQDEVPGPPDTAGVHNVHLAQYHSTHYIATPAESRRQINDVADFLRTVDRG